MEEFKDLMSTSVFKRKLSVVGTPRQSDLAPRVPVLAELLQQMFPGLMGSH